MKKGYRQLLASLALVAALAAVFARHEIAWVTGIGQPTADLAVFKGEHPDRTSFEVSLSSGKLQSMRHPGEVGFVPGITIVMQDSRGEVTEWRSGKTTRIGPRRWRVRATEMTPYDYFPGEKPGFLERVRQSPPKSYTARLSLQNPNADPFARGADARILESQTVTIP